MNREKKHSALIAEVNRICSSLLFRKKIVDFLYEICLINTTPSSSITDLQHKEDAVFQLITGELKNLSFKESTILNNAIDPVIRELPAYSPPYYTASSENRGGIPVSEAYRNRGNLLYYIDHPRSISGRSTALNAHIDIVPPFKPPRLEGDFLYGRGSADDKGNVAVIIGALHILDQMVSGGSVIPFNRITGMFVIDEEIGGNGSLNLAIDRSVKKRYDSLLILECTKNKVHPANRGAVYFTCDGTREVDSISLTESVIYPILEMEKEGDRIRNESDHPVFPHRPVQTCNGILGTFGDHPSAICGEVSFNLSELHPKNTGKIQQAIREGIAGYTEKYGDKTQTRDVKTGESKVASHFIWNQTGNETAHITVYGSTGHMGSLPENDAAITKWAYIGEKLLDCKYNESIDFTLTLAGGDIEKHLILEGAQGFLPTHELEEIKERMGRAFRQGIHRYQIISVTADTGFSWRVTFEKLHNDAFACDLSSPSMQTAQQAAVLAGTMDDTEPLIGWNVSCDARLFAKEYPQLPVITCGAGSLEYAHSENEQVFIPELFEAVMFTVLFLILETGSTYTR